MDEESPTGGRSPSGVAAWRLIADELRAAIHDAEFAVGDRLPAEQELAQRFGVNRHTVRQAIGALAAAGVVEARRGSGTFVLDQPIHRHRIGLRTRLSASIGAPSTGRVLEHAVVDPPPDVRADLGCLGPTIRVDAVRVLAGRPLSLATHWYDAARFPDIVEHLTRSGSTTAALRRAGVADYLRQATRVSARPATEPERQRLDLPAGAVVLVTRGLDVAPDGTPIQVVRTRFPADRVELDVDARSAG